MDQKKFTYSLKNIPLPSKDAFIKRLTEKVENVIKRMRWKAFFFDKDKKSRENDDGTEENNRECLKSRKCPPQIKDMQIRRRHVIINQKLKISESQ